MPSGSALIYLGTQSRPLATLNRFDGLPRPIAAPVVHTHLRPLAMTTDFEVRMADIVRRRSTKGGH